MSQELDQALERLKADPSVTVLNGVEAKVDAYITCLGPDGVQRLYQITGRLTAASGDLPAKVIVNPIGQRT